MVGDGERFRYIPKGGLSCLIILGYHMGVNDRTFIFGCPVVNYGNSYRRVTGATLLFIKAQVTRRICVAVNAGSAHLCQPRHALRRV